MIKLSEHIKDEWKNKQIIKSENNKRLNEGLLRLILEPLGIYYITKWLANFLEKVADYADGQNSKLIPAQRKIIANVGGSDIVKKLDKAFFAGVSASRLADMYVNHPETQKEIQKFKNDKKVIEAGGIEALEMELKKTMEKAYTDERLERETIKDIENALS